MLATVLGPRGSAVNDTNLVSDLMKSMEWGGRQMMMEHLIGNTLTSMQRKGGGYRGVSRRQLTRSCSLLS